MPAARAGGQVSRMPHSNPPHLNGNLATKGPKQLVLIVLLVHAHALFPGAVSMRAGLSVCGGCCRE